MTWPMTKSTSGRLKLMRGIAPSCALLSTTSIRKPGPAGSKTNGLSLRRLRVGRDKWFNLLWLIPIGFVLLVAAVAIGKGLHNMPAVQGFITALSRFRQPSGVAPGMPAWLGWTHFFNLFLMMFIIRSGIQILCDHPRLYFSRNATPGKDEWLRVAKPVPADPLWTAKDDSVALPGQLGLPGIPPLHRAGPMVAPWHRRLVAAQRRRLLRPAVHHRPVAAYCADQLGRLSQRRVGGDPVPVAGLADR